MNPLTNSELQHTQICAAISNCSALKLAMKLDLVYAACWGKQLKLYVKSEPSQDFAAPTQLWGGASSAACFCVRAYVERGEEYILRHCEILPSWDIFDEWNSEVWFPHHISEFATAKRSECRMCASKRNVRNLV